MELRHFRYFVAVAEQESVTRAALRLHVSQSALSRQIADLEEELEVRLFEHGANAIHLTAAGRAFLEEARAVLQRSEVAAHVARTVGGKKNAAINVAYAQSATFVLLPQTLRLFQEANPTVTVNLSGLSPQEMMRGLRDGALDLALTVLDTRRPAAGFEHEEFCRYDVMLAVPTGHPLAAVSRISVKQILDEALVTYKRKDHPSYHQNLEGLFARFGGRPRVVEEHDDDFSLLAAVGAGRGVAFVLEPFANFSVPGVKTCALSPTPGRVGVGVIYPKKRLSAAANNFIASARRAAAKAAQIRSPSSMRLHQRPPPLYRRGT